MITSCFAKFSNASTNLTWRVNAMCWLVISILTLIEDSSYTLLSISISQESDAKSGRFMILWNKYKLLIWKCRGVLCPPHPPPGASFRTPEFSKTNLFDNHFRQNRGPGAGSRLGRLCVKVYSLFFETNAASTRFSSFQTLLDSHSYFLSLKTVTSWTSWLNYRIRSHKPRNHVKKSAPQDISVFL